MPNIWPASNVEHAQPAREHNTYPLHVVGARCDTCSQLLALSIRLVFLCSMQHAIYYYFTQYTLVHGLAATLPVSLIQLLFTVAYLLTYFCVCVCVCWRVYLTDHLIFISLLFGCLTTATHTHTNTPSHRGVLHAEQIPELNNKNVERFVRWALGLLRRR